MALETYIRAFSNLRTDKSPTRWSESTLHKAPHKPLLLLAVIDLFEQGLLTSNLVEPNNELGDLFALYWSKVMPPDRTGNMTLPFYHLTSDNFWHLQPKPGNEAATKIPIRSLGLLRDTVFGAKLDDDLYGSLLLEQQSRNELKTVLIEVYFHPDLQRELLMQSTINFEAYHYSQELLDSARKQQSYVSDFKDNRVRDQGFRRAIVHAYDHRCAFCGVRMLTPRNHTAVEAAHIIPWSLSQNDDICNGLALCKLCHWVFDEGLVSVSSKYKIITSPQIGASNNIPGHIGTLSQRDLLLPTEQVLYPKPEYLQWHRREKFYTH